MSIAGNIVELRPLRTPMAAERLTTLLKTPQVEILQLLIPRGSSIPAHEAVGEIVFHCLEGRVAIKALDNGHELSAGQLFYLGEAAPFSIQGIEDASLLLTIIAPKQGANVELIGEHESS